MAQASLQLSKFMFDPWLGWSGLREVVVHVYLEGVARPPCWELWSRAHWLVLGTDLPFQNRSGAGANIGLGVPRGGELRRNLWASEPYGLLRAVPSCVNWSLSGFCTQMTLPSCNHLPPKTPDSFFPSFSHRPTLFPAEGSTESSSTHLQPFPTMLGGTSWAPTDGHLTHLWPPCPPITSVNLASKLLSINFLYLCSHHSGQL